MITLRHTIRILGFLGAFISLFYALYAYDLSESVAWMIACIYMGMDVINNQ